MKAFLLLIINTGSTSTKVAVYENEKELIKKSLVHTLHELGKYELVSQQRKMRKQAILDFLKENFYTLNQFDIIVSRGGSTLPVEGGAYEVNDEMVERLKNKPFVQHAGILGPVIARELADEAGIKAYVYDSAAVDELQDLSRISGMKEIERVSLVHTLNTRYVSKIVCEAKGKIYEKSSIIAAHMGGGITMSLHHKGRIIDVVGDDEGTFSPDRSGSIPTRQLVDLCFNGKYKTASDVHRIMRGGGGLVSYLGTMDVLEVDKKIDRGDKDAELILNAMVYQICKNLASLSPVVEGKIDFILLTGPLCFSNRIVQGIKKRITFIAPIEVMPGEYEMEALCRGGLSVLLKKEIPKEYKEAKKGKTEEELL